MNILSLSIAASCWFHKSYIRKILLIWCIRKPLQGTHERDQRGISFITSPAAAARQAMQSIAARHQPALQPGFRPPAKRQSRGPLIPNSGGNQRKTIMIEPIQQAAANENAPFAQSEQSHSTAMLFEREKSKAARQLTDRTFCLNTSSCSLPASPALFSAPAWDQASLQSCKAELNIAMDKLDDKDIQ